MQRVSVEEWRPVNGFEGIYEVSSHGRIRCVITGNGRFGGVGKILKNCPHYRTRHHYVGLRKNGKHYKNSVHRMVLIAFRGAPAPEMECCHNDGNPENNHLDNLRWDTHANNSKDRIQHGTTTRGELSGRAILCAQDVFRIRDMHLFGIGSRRLSKYFNVGRQTVQSILDGKNWSHLKGNA
jgi:NUMOD4 motif/HNH endonuclease